MEARLRSEPEKNGLEDISCFFYVYKRLKSPSPYLPMDMARYECFIRSIEPNQNLLQVATKALEAEGFKVRSSLVTSVSLIDAGPVKRMRERVVVQLDENRCISGFSELQCVLINESISSGPNCRALTTFENLRKLLQNLPNVVVQTA
jgi:hypothetical protein